MKKKSFEDTKKKNHEMKSTDTEPFGEYEVLEQLMQKTNIIHDALSKSSI